jgi:hypothetical protein
MPIVDLHLNFISYECLEIPGFRCSPSSLKTAYPVSVKKRLNKAWDESDLFDVGYITRTA